MRKALIIASEVRSGSTFIAESIAYHFESIFGAVLFDLTKEPFAVLGETSSHEQILGIFNSLYLGHEGWVTAKIMCPSLSVIVREARKSDALMQAFFGTDAHWIVIRRRGRIRQAVSLARAQKSGEWHVYGTAKKASKATMPTLNEIEDALRSILFSDIYLESFKNFIPRGRVVEVYYEDFLTDPKKLIECIYAVLGVKRPASGVRYVDRTKIRRQATRAKQLADREFKAWFLESHYAVAKPDPPDLIVNPKPAEGVSLPGENSPRDEEMRFLKSKVAALQLEIDTLTRQVAGVSRANRRV